MYKLLGKRLLDILFSAAGLVLLSPVMMVVAIMIAVRLGRPVIFAQIRPGKDGQLFKLYKFRTMADLRDTQGNLLPDDMRMTNFGRKLRGTSLDELPELFNILRGDMSLVGPRPFLVTDIVFYTEREMFRKSVLPGLTGLAQISGRNNITWEQKFAYDFEYIRHIRLWEDMRIMYRTFFKVAEQSDIATDGMETAERYGIWLMKQGKLTAQEYEMGLLKAKRMIEEFEGT